MNIDVSGLVRRSTSSIKYKTQVEDAEYGYSEALLNCRPVWYRSTCPSDDPRLGWWGFIAEEVALIDPRLVFWKTTEKIKQEDGEYVDILLEEPEAEGVQYDRFVPHLLSLIKDQNKRIKVLETKVQSLKL
jgi:hypothetical protein